MAWRRNIPAGSVATDGAATLRGQAEAESANLPELLLAAERLAATVHPGAHGIRRAGAGEEFWQYRPAGPGDPAAVIDWRRSARSDATFVRERETQAPQSAALWVAGGAGMEWTGSPARPTKRARGQLIALALGLTLLRSGERVGIGEAHARPGRMQAGTLARDLVGPSGDLPGPLILRPHRRLVLIGDFLQDTGPLERLLAAAAATGCTGAMLQVLDPAEEAFPFEGAVRFRAPAGPVHSTRNAGALRADYLARLAERRATLGRLADSAGWRFGTHSTAAAPALALLWLAQVLGR